jgi:hypothetical protein
VQHHHEWVELAVGELGRRFQIDRAIAADRDRAIGPLATTVAARQ